MRLDPDFVQELIFGPRLARGGSIRFTQDSPVLPDVWHAYGRDPASPSDLLLTPHIQASAGVVGAEIRRRLAEDQLDEPAKKSAKGKGKGQQTVLPIHKAARVAYNQFHVAATLRFDQMVRLVMPLTSWWHRYVGDQRVAFLHDLSNKAKRKEFAAVLEQAFYGRVTGIDDLPPELLWIANIVGALTWAQDRSLQPQLASAVEQAVDGPQLRRPTFEEIADAVHKALKGCREENLGKERSIWTVNRNREAEACVLRSVPAIKADAARQLFDISCKDVAWAVLDTGIDASHPAFRDNQKWEKAKSDNLPAAEMEKWWNFTRIDHTYDFMRIRDLLDPAKLGAPPGQRPEWLEKALVQVKESRIEEHRTLFGRGRDSALEKQIAQEVASAIKDLERHLQLGWQINWGLLEPFLRVPHDETYTPPAIDHGTHVAGILGAGELDEDGTEDKEGIGVCPDIRLYDLRVLGDDGDEFSVISALQFVSWLNGHRDYLVVHGANLSISIRHEVQSYACGATPVCEEADRLVSSGVVVVAAAGNHGHQTFRTSLGPREGYLTVSITDPGNAEKVITVGATHRFSPHTYGVSYFSSRGPTGDGRLKPDLVAPGEKVRGPLPGGEWGRKDGTSMAAPHVSGAAALLIARHTELMGRGERVKQILTDTATDLGRERYFQGKGMLDVLRALQSV